MAGPKKNQLFQVIFPMVDKTDFASIESGITASDFNSAATKKFYGVNHGGSAAYTSGTISKATTLVTSGIFQQTVKATEANYDYLMLRFVHPSCADQILVFNMADYDDSDLMSRLSDVGSDLLSYLAGMSGMLSDIRSNVSDLQSDFQSRVPKAVATASRLLLAESVISDAHSAAAQANSRALVIQSLVSDVDSALTSHFLLYDSTLSDIRSNVSDLQSDFQSRVPKLVATNSQVSDLVSDLRSYLVGMSGMLSDTHSAAILGASHASDAYSVALLNASAISNVESALDSQFVYYSNVLSDIDREVDRLDAAVVFSRNKAQAGNPNALTLAATEPATNSLYNDLTLALVDGTGKGQARPIINYVGATKIATVNPNWEVTPDSTTSYILRTDFIGHSHIEYIVDNIPVILSNLSDVQSALDSQFAIGQALNASTLSDLRSAITAAEFDASDLSDIGSRVYTVLVSDLSDILSAAQQGNSRVLVLQSNLSDVQSALDSQFAAGQALDASTMSDIRSAIAANAPTDYSSNFSDIYSATTQANSRILVSLSNLSDIESQVDLNASMISDIDSALTLHDANISGMLSDIDSQLDVTHSLLSDVESQVDLLPTASAIISDIWSAATADPLKVNIKEVNDTSILGDGSATAWGPE